MTANKTWTTFSLICAILQGAVVSPGLSRADAPQLVLNSAGHTAQVTWVQFLPDDKRVISVSRDKTIRIWDVDRGETISVLRPPIGAGPLGELVCGALSPDAKYLAVGGATAGVSTGTRSILLINLQSGRI